jgi:HSP20 family protein
MTITRWSPVLGLSRSRRENAALHDEVDRLFESFFGSDPRNADAPARFAPPVDIEERPEAFVVHMDLPGVSQKDVKVSLLADVLTIRGERKNEHQTQEGNRHRMERVYGVFERSFQLGAPVRSDQIRATYRDGVLEVVIPKAEEAKLKEIEIQVG